MNNTLLVPEKKQKQTFLAFLIGPFPYGFISSTSNVFHKPKFI